MMSGFNILYGFIFVILIVLIFLLFKRTNAKYKPSTLKRAELIKKYEYEMLQLIAKYEKDKDLLQEKKIEYLKNLSNELDNNIFFDENEVKSIIERLASY
jgi:hypothetical protein